MIRGFKKAEAKEVEEETGNLPVVQEGISDCFTAVNVQKTRKKRRMKDVYGQGIVEGQGGDEKARTCLTLNTSARTTLFKKKKTPAEAREEERLAGKSEAFKAFHISSEDAQRFFDHSKEEENMNSS